MNKKLLLIRHAKSDWGDAGLTDFNRPLNPRGIKASAEMAQRIKMQQLIPEKLVTSPALRAFTTSEIMAKTWGKDVDLIEKYSKIYEASVVDLLSIVNGFDDACDSTSLFGHNNAITDLAVYLTDQDIFNIPTCGVVLIEFPFNSWQLVSKHTGSVIMYDFPKNQG